MCEFSLPVKLEDERFCDSLADEKGADDCPALDTEECVCKALFDEVRWKHRPITIDKIEDGSLRAVRPEWCPMRKTVEHTYEGTPNE